MSWQIINEILGLATIDKEFARELLKNPLTAVQKQGFQLTPKEQEVFNTISANTLQEFSRDLFQALKQNPLDRD